MVSTEHDYPIKFILWPLMIHHYILHPVILAMLKRAEMFRLCGPVEWTASFDRQALVLFRNELNYK